MDRIRYAADKPQDCKYCYFWQGKVKGCQRQQCYYFLPEKPKEAVTNISPVQGECKDCPYGRIEPCVGYCIDKILHEMKGCT